MATKLHVAALAVICQVALGSSAVRAQSVYEALFGPIGRPAPAVTSPSIFAPLFPEAPPPVRRRPIRTFDESAIPKPVMPKVAKPATVKPDKEIVQALLGDRTLQAGDIVVFPDGPRVFKGSGYGGAHRLRDFEELQATRKVDSRTRQAVLAATRGNAVHQTAALSRTASREVRERADVETTGAVASKR
jgi:hypothetical protein